MSLPKVISQETFDQVVLENVVDFEKSLPEAIEEATSEFTAQGVLLTNIIKDLHLSPNNDSIVHPILEAVMELKKLSSFDEVDKAAPSDASEKVFEPLRKLSEECKLSLAHRVLGTSNGAYVVLLKIIEIYKDDPEQLAAALTAMYSLTEGNPDILEGVGVKLLAQLMDNYKQDLQSYVMEALARWSCHCNFKHENNRQLLFNAGIPHSLVASLKNCNAETHKTRILATLKALRSFTLDDDIRTEFGKAHENCRHLVEEEGLIQVALDIIKGCLDTKIGAVAGECLAIMSSICVRAEYCQQACDSNALEVINGILENFPESVILTKQSITLISTLAGDDKVKAMVMKTSSPYLITAAMDKHQLNVAVCTSCCSAVSMLALRHPQHAVQLVQCGAASGVLQAMKQHPMEKQLQKMGCLAVRNLCSRSQENANSLRELQAEELVQNAVATHGDSLKDMAKSALRDMGAEVTLEEVWHGKGHEIDQ